MPIVAGLFLLYGFFGNLLPAPWQHQGYGTERLIPHLTITLDGIFGTAVDVSASLIILFTIYGAILQASGAGKFFVDFSFALTGGRATSAGRTVVLSSFLLGGPSGSGVATTVTLGTVAWPMMRRVGYRPDDAGGLLAAGGLGAIISPPVLGAAAFLIAEYLKIGYLEVLRMAAVPTVLYYASLLFMVELDQRRIGAEAGAVAATDAVETERAGALARRYWFHFSSLLAIVVFMVLGYSPTLSVLYAMVVAVLLSFLRSESALWPRKLLDALASGAVQAVGIAATCACAGVIVGVITLTGLGLKFSDIAIQAAGGSLVVTAIYTALIVWVVGLAVPVTASYIICAVVAAPALIKLGVPDYAAHMFVFYYAVLVRGVAADRAQPLRRRRHHRRRSLPHHAQGVEVHPAGLRAALRLRHRPGGRRPAPRLPPRHGLGRRRLADPARRRRPRPPVRRLPGLRARPDAALGARRLRGRRPAAGVPGTGSSRLRRRGAGAAPHRPRARRGAAPAALAPRRGCDPLTLEGSRGSCYTSAPKAASPTTAESTFQPKWRPCVIHALAAIPQTRGRHAAATAQGLVRSSNTHGAATITAPDAIHMAVLSWKTARTSDLA